MNPTEHPTTTLKDSFTTYLTADIYDPERLAEWCKRTYPAVESCREFRKQLLDAIQHPGLISPKTYERWTDDDDYPTQELLQAHFKTFGACAFRMKPPHLEVE